MAGNPKVKFDPEKDLPEVAAVQKVNMTFTDDFQITKSATDVLMIPRGWSGEVDQDVAEAALDQGKAELI
jgi:hypothetical protein